MKSTKGVIDNKTKLIKMMYNGQEIPPNSHIAEIMPCPFCAGNVGYIVKPCKNKRRKYEKVERGIKKRNRLKKA